MVTSSRRELATSSNLLGVRKTTPGLGFPVWDSLGFPVGDSHGLGINSYSPAAEDTVVFSLLAGFVRGLGSWHASFGNILQMAPAITQVTALHVATRHPLPYFGTPERGR